MKPELFPVVDHDGIVKPSLLINVEQMILAGIERVLVVIQQVLMDCCDG